MQKPHTSRFLQLLLACFLAPALAFAQGTVFTEDFEGADPLASWADASGSVTDYMVVTDPDDATNMAVYRPAGGGNFQQVRVPFDSVPATAQTVLFTFRWRTDSIQTSWGDFLNLGNFPNRLRFQKSRDAGGVRFDFADDMADTDQTFLTGLSSATWYDVSIFFDKATKTMTYGIDGQTGMITANEFDVNAGIKNIFIGGNPTVGFHLDDLQVAYDTEPSTGGGGGSADGLTPPFTLDFEGDDALEVFGPGNGTTDDIMLATDPDDATNMVLHRPAGGGNFKTVKVEFDSVPATAQTISYAFRWRTDSVNTSWGDFLNFGDFPNRIGFQKSGDDGTVRIAFTDDGSDAEAAFVGGIEQQTWYDVKMIYTKADSSVAWSIGDQSGVITAQKFDSTMAVRSFFIGGNENVGFYLDNISVRFDEQPDTTDGGGGENPALLTPDFCESFDGDDPLDTWLDGSGSTDDISIAVDPDNADNMVLFRDGANFQTVKMPFNPVDSTSDITSFSFRWRTESVSESWGDYVVFGDFPNRIRFQKSEMDTVRFDFADDGNPGGLFIAGAKANEWQEIQIEYNRRTKLLTATIGDSTGTLMAQNFDSLAPVQTLFVGGNENVNFYLDDLCVDTQPLRPVSNREVVRQQRNIRAFPNPARGVFTLAADVAGLENPTVTVFSPVGQRIFRGPLQPEQTMVDLGDVPPGLYLYRIAAAGRAIYTGRVVVVR